MNYFKKCEDIVAYSFSVDVSIDVTVIVQLPVFIPGVVEGFYNWFVRREAGCDFFF
jgi:hypothetical protein